jgi:ribosomal protein L11 methyltransferase
VPYRIDLRNAGEHALDRLVDLGALDVEAAADGAITALMPDRVSPDEVAEALNVAGVSVAPAIGRDDGSVWILSPRAVRIGRLQIVPAHMQAEPGALRLRDAGAFGTGLHPTTALCIEAIEDTVSTAAPESLLDVGTGSGVLALAALLMGVPRAMGLDVDEEALRVAAENARLNGLDERLQLACAGPDAMTGTWPFVVANVLAAPLIDMAPALARRLGHHGQLVLSGIPSSVEQDVAEAYSRLGMQAGRVRSRGGWVALVMQASW